MYDFYARYQKISTIEDVSKLHYEFVKIHPFVDGN
jgi:Fic family protein